MQTFLLIIHPHLRALRDLALAIVWSQLATPNPTRETSWGFGGRCAKQSRSRSKYEKIGTNKRLYFYATTSSVAKVLTKTVVVYLGFPKVTMQPIIRLTSAAT